MIILTRQVDYGVQFLKALAVQKNGKSLSVRQFSHDSTISFLFLQRIVRKLKLHGIIHSERGPSGGYVLARPDMSISLSDVIDAVEGPHGIVQCLKAGKMCERKDVCTARPTFQSVQDTMNHMFREIRIV